MNNKTFLDANIIMELFFDRTKRPQVLRYMEEQDGKTQYITAILSTHVLFYYVEAERIDKAEVHAFLSQYAIMDMNEADYLWAQDNDQGDFEDALQAACALRHGCRKFLTLDRKLAKRHRKHISITLIG